MLSITNGVRSQYDCIDCIIVQFAKNTNFIKKSFETTNFFLDRLLYISGEEKGGQYENQNFICNYGCTGSFVSCIV